MLTLFVCLIFAIVGVMTAMDALRFQRMTPAQHLNAAKAAMSNLNWDGALQHLEVIRQQKYVDPEWQSLLAKAHAGFAAQQDALARRNAESRSRDSIDSRSIAGKDKTTMMYVTNGGDWGEGERRRCELEVSSNPTTLVCPGDSGPDKSTIRAAVLFHGSMTVTDWSCQKTGDELECWNEGSP